MANKPKPSNRIGKRAAQFFVSPSALSRFKAACALTEADMTDVIERLMLEYAASRGIPDLLTDSKPKPRR